MISFILPAHNEAELIGRTLSALNCSAGALGEPYEVIVVNDASTDRTGAIALEQGARVAAVSHRQIAATRNAGARAAVGDPFIFVDADTLVNARVLRAALRCLRCGAVGGGCVIRIDGRLPLYARALAGLLSLLQPVVGLPGGCFIFCTRRAYIAAGGFDETLYAAEEIAFSRCLMRRGRFVILREFVVTSGRKLRTHTGLDLLRLFTRLALAGPRSLRRREGLEWWYGPRPPASDRVGMTAQRPNIPALSKRERFQDPGTDAPRSPWR